MSNPVQQTNNTNQTTQYIDNLGNDSEFGVQIVEMAVWDSIKNVLRRVTSDAIGHFATNDVDKSSSTLFYEGTEDCDGIWVIGKTEKTGDVTSIRYATQKNNPTVTNYGDAWTSRATLEYGYYSVAF